MSNENEKLETYYDIERDIFVIKHTDLNKFKYPMVEIRKEVFEGMSFKEASQFIGQRIILLTPQLREQFKDYLWTDDGKKPPKKIS